MTIQSLTYTTGITHKHLTSGKAFRASGKLTPQETNKGEVFQSLFKYEARDNGRKLELGMCANPGITKEIGD